MKLTPESQTLTFEDLGIELEEDSPDLTDEEVSGAVDIDDPKHLTSKIVEFVQESGVSPVVSFELRRRAGIHYSRVVLECGSKRVFSIRWIRRVHE